MAESFSPEVQAAALQLFQHMLLRRQDNGTAGNETAPDGPTLAPPPATYDHGDTAWILTSTVSRLRDLATLAPLGC